MLFLYFPNVGLLSRPASYNVLLPFHENGPMKNLALAFQASENCELNESLSSHRCVQCFQFLLTY